LSTKKTWNSKIHRFKPRVMGPLQPGSEEIEPDIENCQVLGFSKGE